jgi:hypothetical protein
LARPAFGWTLRKAQKPPAGGGESRNPMGKSVENFGGEKSKFQMGFSFKPCSNLVRAKQLKILPEP